MAVQIMIKVVPASGRQGWTLDKSGQLKCFLKSPAEKGLANKELIKNLATALHISQNSITIVGGLTTRIKRINIQTSMTVSQIEAVLGIERQQSLC